MFFKLVTNDLHHISMVKCISSFMFGWYQGILNDDLLINHLHIFHEQKYFTHKQINPYCSGNCIVDLLVIFSTYLM